MGNIFKELMSINSVEYKTKSSKANKPVPTAFTHVGIYGESKQNTQSIIPLGQSQNQCEQPTLLTKITRFCELLS
jgi:hypothetical protein